MNQSTTLRLFVAVEPPRELRDRLFAALGALRRRYDAVKWEKADKLHFTLKFLGDVYEAAIPNIEASLGTIGETRSSFSAAFGRIGCFPSPAKPRIIWAGLCRGGHEMTILQEAVERELNARGFSPERRPFRPHLTVGRIRRRVQLVNLDSYELPADEFDIGELILKKSKLTSKGSFYTDLYRYPLRPLCEQESRAP
jgi:2'-5' RNA ligase